MFESLFGKKERKCQEIYRKEPSIIDVRTPAEFLSGHAAGSINIPLDSIEGHMEDIKQTGKPVVLCCASGMRSGRATKVLKRNGIECCNGGSWRQVHYKMTEK